MGTEPKNKQTSNLGVRLDSSLLKQFKASCEYNQTSQAQVLKAFIEDYNRRNNYSRVSIARFLLDELLSAKLPDDEPIYLRKDDFGNLIWFSDDEDVVGETLERIKVAYDQTEFPPEVLSKYFFEQMYIDGLHYGSVKQVKTLLQDILYHK